MVEKTSSLPARDNTLAMAGCNTYNENCGQQHQAMEASLPLFADINLSCLGPNISIADYGCSQGATSLHVMQRIVAGLPPRSVATLLFNDLPSNDFNSLIKLLSNLAPNPTTSMHPFIVPNSFYNHVFPPSTIDIAFALSAVHWLRELPPPKLPTETTEEYLSKRASRNDVSSHKDLVCFLNLRGYEIKPGGKFVLASPSPIADDSDGRKTGNTKLRLAIFRAMDILMEAGKLPSDASAGVYPPAHVHTKESLYAAVAETKMAWTIEDLYYRVVPHPAYIIMLDAQARAGSDETKKVAAAEVYAAVIVDWFLAVLKPFMLKWWIERGLTEDKGEMVFQECSQLAKKEVMRNGGVSYSVAQDYVFARLRRE
ncbi:hypothetical protein H072_5963 [Dactylellina haptotyla CBS 200.50]|uniref:S-adenosyl-L-methionine-dependent methyltransferase n=1 Tax=Dactylellina haptotyla (strain CBS 200.50) TaxID=1284197 RepID=S8AGD9_DACHA|nr:hypothetical protein H072_5963 [Dactylellina haptotyla CBS 200.50]